MKIYNGSKEHLENCARARAAANVKVECIYCKQLIQKCSITQHERSCTENPITYKFCEQCGARILKHGSKFCSKSCAATYNNSRRTVSWGEKIGDTLRTNYASGKNKSRKRSDFCGESFPGSSKYYTLENVPGHKSCKITISQCTVCGVHFLQRGWGKTVARRITCSPDCQHEASMTKANPFRALSIPFNHKGTTIRLQSYWEEKVANYLNQKKIDWIRPKSVSWQDDDGKKRRYYPDFYLPDFDVYLDPKNLHVQKADERKIEIVSQQIDVVVGVLDEIIWFIDELVGNSEPAPVVIPIEIIPRPLHRW